VTKLTVAFRNFANASRNMNSLVIGNNIATGFSDYLTLFMTQRQLSLQEEVLLIAQRLNGDTNKYVFKSRTKITALQI